MHAPFTQPWADAFHAVINADAAYRKAASGWKWPVALVLDPARPDIGYPDSVAVEVALDRGVSHGARVVPGATARADVSLAADYDTWKEVIRGTVDPVLGVATGRIRLVNGSLLTLMMHTGAAKALVHCAAQVPTRFPDETPA